MQPNGKRLVSIVLPDGEVENFRVKAKPECSPIIPVIDVYLTFEPVNDIDYTLEQLDLGQLRLVGSSLLDFFNPRNLYGEAGRLTTQTDPERKRIEYTHEWLATKRRERTR